MGRPSSALQRGLHGTVAAYGAGCRCRRCRDARRAYDRTWRGVRQLQRTGELRRLVDPGPAASSVAALQAAGWTVDEVAAAVPCGPATVARIASSARRGRGRTWSTIAERLVELAQAVEVAHDVLDHRARAEVEDVARGRNPAPGRHEHDPVAAGAGRS